MRLSNRQSPTARQATRRWVGWLAAFVLLVFAPPLVWGAVHQHTLGPESDTCAACVVTHAPVVQDDATLALADPRESQHEALPVALVSFTSAFSFAAPLACGPPA